MKLYALLPAAVVVLQHVLASAVVKDSDIQLSLGLDLLALSASADASDKCPPCFNCMLPAFPCRQFGTCNEYTGRCDCPEGFGGEDCSQPVCGHLGEGANRPLRNGTFCDCTNGWEGINCNMCTDNKSCDAFMPGGESGTCYKGGILVNENHQSCKVTNRKILDILKGKIPEVTFSCNKTGGDCSFQFWIDQRESFYCGLNNCEFQVPDEDHPTNSTKYSCKNIECACIPDRMLCGEAGSIDITDFLSETVRGPGEFNCDLNTGRCEFSEPSMNNLIHDVFGDSYITLDCESSECLHYTELPGYRAPVKETKRSFVIAALISALVFVVAGVSIFKFFIERSQKAHDTGSIRLPLDNNGLTKLITQHKPASLQFKNLGYTSENNSKILEGVSGSVQAGELLAIMGGSGAGKTTLLDILAKKHKRGHVSGEIYLNGTEIDDTKYKQMIGFVDQNDLLMPTLTVHETVLYSALLRLPRAMDDDAKRIRVLETMSELGIMGIKDRIIGDETNRGISGGEKRRVAIACELVTSPSILFLDEPTSGLDSYNAFNVMECLTQLAQNYHRTVVLSIHQPRSNIVSLFDKLLLLAKGKLVYFGQLDDCARFFADAGYPCPSGYNVADYLVDLTMQASSGRSYASIAASSEASIPQNTDGDEDIHAPPRSATQEFDSTREWRHLQAHQQDMQPDSKQPKPQVQSTQVPADVQLNLLIAMYQNSALAEGERRKIEDAINSASSSASSSDDPLSDEKILKAPIYRQFLILSGRTFKNIYRNPMLLFTHYVIAVLLAVFCGLLYYNVSNDISGFQNRLGLFFFLLALFGFSTLTTLNLFADERVIFVRERANDYYQPISYYLSKVVFDVIPLRVLPPILLGLIVYPLVGLSTDDGAFWKFLLILVLFNLTAASICLMIGILIQDAGVASLVGCLVMLFSLLFAGLFLNQDSMPPGTVWFKYLSIFHYAYEALAVNEVKYLTLTEKKFGLSIEVPGATILSTFGFDSSALWTDVIGLAVFFGVFLIAGYVCLHVVLVERR